MSELSALRYEGLYLYSERKQIASVSFRAVLDLNLIDYQLLEYDADVVGPSIAALNTWVFDTGRPNFTAMPILVYNKILWESPDKSEKFAKLCYAVSAEDLPSDFVEKTVKI